MQKRINQLEQKLRELGQHQFLDSLDQHPKQPAKQLKKLNRIFQDPSYVHIAFKLAYNGINYQGLECQQDNHLTIEYHLFKALQKLTFIQSPADCQYARAGRTDKGVSAIGNVISLRIRKIDNLNETESERINRLLPPEICILDQKLVSETFSARYNCIQRVYKYFFFRSTYNIELMREHSQAALLYLGEHDFRNFCKTDVIANQHFIRTIYNISIDQFMDPFQLNKSEIFASDDRMDLFCITIKGNAFLWHQIRCMVQVLFLIGKGQEDKNVITQLFEIDEDVGKPQYELAADYQLVLYDCQYKEEELKFDNNQMGIQMNIYARLREKLSQDYMGYLVLSLMGMSSMGKEGGKVSEEQRKKEKEKQKEKQSRVLPIMKMQRGECIRKQIQNLKGKRKEMYEQKMERVREYERKMKMES